MAKRHNTQDQHTFQEQQMIKELLAELQVIDDRRQCAVRFHTLMNQHCLLEIPVQYERLFLHVPTGKEENNHDYRRGTKKSHRRRVPHQRV